MDDLKSEHRKKLENILIDAPLGNRAKELFDTAATKLDPSIYKGESKGYRADGEKYESSLDTQNKMAEKSENVKDWISRQRYEAESKLPPHQRGYNFNRDTADAKLPSYNASFEDVAKQYLMGEGKELYQHLRKKGRDFYDITRIGTDLEGKLGKDTIAAVAIKGSEAALIGPKDFEKKIVQFASNYGISVDRALKYVMAHEFVHASQKGKYFDDHVLAELDVEHTLKEYFTAKGDHDLAAVASDRAANVTRNYAGAGTYRMPKGIGEKGSLESYVGAGKGYSGALSGSGKGYAGKAASSGGVGYSASGSGAAAAAGSGK